MKWAFLIALCLVLCCAGCLEQKESSARSSLNSTEKSAEKLTATITSPHAGEILQGNRDFSFDAVIGNGKTPLSYRWSSNIDGELSTSRKFMQNPSRLSKGGHVIILKVTDAAGSSVQGSILIDVM